MIIFFRSSKLVTTKMMEKSFVQSYKRVDLSLQKASSDHYLKSELDQISIRVLKFQVTKQGQKLI